jgi:SP family sugar:H+ symporter-like MFS transporter
LSLHCGAYADFQTTGQQFANSYGPSFFTSIGLGQQSFQYSILIAMAGLFGCLVAVATTDIIGRRWLCIIGAALAILFCALIGGIGPIVERTAAQNNVVIASVILLNGVCKLGVASQCWLIGSEIGGIQMRKRMLGWATSIDVLSAFLVTFCTPYLQAGPVIQMGARVGFVFMGSAILALIFFILFLPELKVCAPIILP